MGDKEVEYHPEFRLILHTKLANPHYKPEMQAQTTLINFTVTREGLEDQLLADVVRKERPDLEETKVMIWVVTHIPHESDWKNRNCVYFLQHENLLRGKLQENQCCPYYLALLVLFLTLFVARYQLPRETNSGNTCRWYNQVYVVIFHQANLTQQMNQFTIKIKELEDSLLARLSAAGGNFLGDYALVENLENTKRTAAEIEVKVAEGKTTEVKINEAREQYRPAAARSSLLYFILNDLNKINPIYQFSLKVSCKEFCRFAVRG